MSEPTILIGTLCLNEMEWLPRLYEQHKDWPGLVRWVFVESADRVYAEANPDLVSPAGLSVDGTSEFLRDLATRDPRVTYIPFGVSSHRWASQGKCKARNEYLRVANELSPSPSFVFVLDADEFYTREDQRRVVEVMANSHQWYTAFRFRQREIWRPASIADQPLLQFEVVGGFWEMVHTRGWRFVRGMRYRNNHNYPENTRCISLAHPMVRAEDKLDKPHCVHLAFASLARMRAAKNAYYVARGEGKADRRGAYVEARAAFETWQPGDVLPGGAEVVPYTGPVPEVFAGGDA